MNMHSQAVATTAVKRAPTRSALDLWSSTSAGLWAIRIVAVSSFFILWEQASTRGWIDPLFISSPSIVLTTLYQMFANGTIYPHLWASFSVVMAGFVMAVVVGVPLGLMMGRSERIRAALEPFTIAKMAAPTVAFLPLLIIWLGIGFKTRVALVFIGCFLIMAINTEAGVAQTDRRLRETARSFMATSRQLLWMVELPSSLPYIIAGMRLAVGRALIMIVVAELFGASQGLGYLIFQAGGMFDTSQVFVGVIILAATGIILNSSLRALERLLSPWRADAR